jgi:TetR/AcrR family transcriptional regulator, acrAB operon repressor
MARKTKKEAEQTRTDILDAAVRVFSVRGVSRTALNDIAKEAGVTRGAIYWHFNNKTDLLGALWDQLFLPIEPIVQASESEDETDPLGRMREALLSLFTSLANDPMQLQLFRILHDKCELVEDTGTEHLHRANCHRDGLKRIGIVLSNAVARKQLPQGYDIHLASIATISFIDGLLANWLMFPTLIRADREIPLLVDELMLMLRRGFLSSAQNDQDEE